MDMSRALRGKCCDDVEQIHHAETLTNIATNLQASQKAGNF
jgi:hypothetical protein